MLSWIRTNLASIAVSAVLLVIVFLIVRKLILDRRAGRHTCGCSCSGGCSGCSMHGQCGSK